MSLARRVGFRKQPPNRRWTCHGSFGLEATTCRAGRIGTGCPRGLAGEIIPVQESDIDSRHNPNRSNFCSSKLATQQIFLGPILHRPRFSTASNSQI